MMTSSYLGVDDSSKKNEKSLFRDLLWKIIMLRIVRTKYYIFSHLGRC